MTEFKLTEEVVELGYGEYWNLNPINSDVRPEWEHLEFDNASCSRGHLCPSYDRTHGTTRVLGGYIGSDSEGIYPAERWEAPWYFPSARGLAMCEDCADIVTAGEESCLFTGTIADVTWFIDADDDGRIWAWLGRFAPDHGLEWEHELGEFHSVGAARMAIAIWGAERNAELDRIEAELDRMAFDEFGEPVVP